jgi:hypothetical protein
MSISTYFRPNIHQNGPEILGINPSIILPASHYGCWLSIQKTLTIWLVEGKSLSTRGQRTIASKIPTWQYFLEVLAPRVWQVEKNLSAIFMETQTLLKWTNFSFPNLYKIYKLYILMYFYLVFLRRVCQKSSWPDGHSMKCP